MSDTWETFCDECYYHMWRVRRKDERHFNDGFHVNNREEANALVELLNGLERERDEAKFDLQFRRELYALQTKELGEAREQRDRLAEALRDLMFDCLRFRIEPSDKTYQDAEEALAFVKGGTP